MEDNHVYTEVDDLPEENSLSYNHKIITSINGTAKTSTLVEVADYILEMHNCKSTLFVDPYGNNETAVIGNFNKKWQTVSAAIDFLANNNLQGYTIIVLPGTYTEMPWNFYNEVSSLNYHTNNNTTVKLMGGCNITFTGDGIILDNNYTERNPLNIAIIGESTAVKNLGGTGTTIECGYGHNIKIVSHATSTSNSSDINLTLLNIAFDCKATGYNHGIGTNIINYSNIAYQGYFTGKFRAENCTFNNDVFFNLANNNVIPSIWDATLILKNTYWQTQAEGDILYSNLRFVDTAGVLTTVNFFIENSQFCMKGTYGGMSHIFVNPFTNSNRYNIYMSNLIFWAGVTNNYIIYNSNTNSLGVKLVVNSPVIGNGLTAQHLTDDLTRMLINNALPDISVFY